MIKDIIVPGFVGTSTIKWIVTRGIGEASAVVGNVAVLTTFELKRPHTDYANRTYDTDFELKRPRTTYEMDG